MLVEGFKGQQDSGGHWALQFFSVKLASATILDRWIIWVLNKYKKNVAIGLLKNEERKLITLLQDIWYWGENPIKSHKLALGNFTLIGKFHS